MRRILALVLESTLLLSGALAADGRPNVLFIAGDDMRPELGCYGERNGFVTKDEFIAGGKKPVSK